MADDKSTRLSRAGDRIANQSELKSLEEINREIEEREAKREQSDDRKQSNDRKQSDEGNDGRSGPDQSGESGTGNGTTAESAPQTPSSTPQTPEASSPDGGSSPSMGMASSVTGRLKRRARAAVSSARRGVGGVAAAGSQAAKSVGDGIETTQARTSEPIFEDLDGDNEPEAIVGDFGADADVFGVDSDQDGDLDMLIGAGDASQQPVSGGLKIAIEEATIDIEIGREPGGGGGGAGPLDGDFNILDVDADGSEDNFEVFPDGN
jgi:hypothetical protein